MGLDMYMFAKAKKGKKPTEPNEIDVYWRKANHIHCWFVDNVGGGVDECQEMKVSKRQLQKLLRTVKEVLDSVCLEKGNVKVGYTYEKGEKKYFTEPGWVVANPEVCEELLPTQAGFFFGSTEYDQYYVQDLEETYLKLKDLLENTDFENYDVYYQASW